MRPGLINKSVDYNVSVRASNLSDNIAWKINQIQKAMGIEISQFPELAGMSDEESEEIRGEVQLRKEEEKEAEQENEWNISFGTNEESSELTDEWSEEEELRKEERQERQAEEDWWTS